MGFISFSLEFYGKELNKLESYPVNGETVYRAKQLLKMLDDLLDEGHTELNDELEKTCSGVSRLRKYLQNNNATPFPVIRKPLSESDIVYGRRTYELEAAVEELIFIAKKARKLSTTGLCGTSSAFASG